MHLGDPVAQRVHHQLQRDGVAGVQRVAAAGRVVVEAGVAGLDPVVGQVVDAAETQRRAVRLCFGGVVEHHVEDHFQAGLVQRVDHGLELGHLPALAAGPHRGGVAVVGGEEADGVVAPVVRQALRDQERLGHVLVYREQLDGGDAQVAQVGDSGIVAQAGVGAAQLGRDVGVAHGEALDVDFVDDRVRVAVPGPLIVVPAELRVDNQAAGHVPGGVQGGPLAGVGRVLAEHLGPERDRSADRLGVGVEEQLGRVAPQAPVRVPRAVDPVPVGLARADSRHERMPDVGVVIRQRDPGFGACRIEQAQGDAAGDARGDREVRARHAHLLAGRGAQRELPAGQRGARADVGGGPGGRDRPGRGGGFAGSHCRAPCAARSRRTSPSARTAP